MPSGTLEIVDEDLSAEEYSVEGQHYTELELEAHRAGIDHLAWQSEEARQRAEMWKSIASVAGSVATILTALVPVVVKAAEEEIAKATR